MKPKKRSKFDQLPPDGVSVPIGGGGVSPMNQQGGAFFDAGANSGGSFGGMGMNMGMGGVNMRALGQAALTGQALPDPVVKQPFTGHGTVVSGVGVGATDPSTKIHRDIYVGNIPVGIQEAVLSEFFRAAIEAASLNVGPGNPM